MAELTESERTGLRTARRHRHDAARTLPGPRRPDAVYLGSARERRRTGLFIAVTAMAEMLAILLFSFSPEYVLSLALMFVVGAAAVLTQSLTNTTLQLSAPDRIRGRVMGAYSFGTQGMRVVNGPLLGGLATIVGVPFAVAGSAGLVLAVLGLALLAVPQLRTADRT